VKVLFEIEAPNVLTSQTLGGRALRAKPTRPMSYIYRMCFIHDLELHVTTSKVGIEMDILDVVLLLSLSLSYCGLFILTVLSM
jgi:hypothetical protein